MELMFGNITFASYYYHVCCLEPRLCGYLVVMLNSVAVLNKLGNKKQRLKSMHFGKPSLER